MIQHSHNPRFGSLRPLLRADGHTLISLTIASVMSAVVLTGAWVAFSSIQAQWRVANADRQMDQYAHSAMMELTNVLSWAWGAVEIQGGPRSTRWKFGMQDLIEENGSFDNWTYRREAGPETIEPPGGFITFTYHPTKGILFSGTQPLWAGSREGSQYQWYGTSSGRGLKAFDRRDRMTVEGITMDFNPFMRFRESDPIQNLKRHAVVQVQITMHYEYNSPYGFGLFSRNYVRERTFYTQINMRNWDTENNGFKDDILGDAGEGPSGA